MRLIDADALIGALHNYAFLEGDDRSICYNVIQRQPTIDAVPVVRCKDCKHRPKGTGANHDLEFPDYVCPCQNPEDYWYSWKPDDDWFCADGERKEE